MAVARNLIPSRVLLLLLYSAITLLQIQNGSHFSDVSDRSGVQQYVAQHRFATSSLRTPDRHSVTGRQPDVGQAPGSQCKWHVTAVQWQQWTMVTAHLVVMSPSQTTELDILQLVIQVSCFSSVLVNCEHLDVDPVRATAAQCICHQLAVLAELGLPKSHLPSLQ